MNFGFSVEERAFRAEARGFLADKLTPDVRRAQRLTTAFFPEYEVSNAWREILFLRGWVAPAWPERHGGTGWSITERFIWASECARAGAPRVTPIGLNLVGPVLMRFATEAQQAHYLPRILSGKDYWCQGFSETGAGSDLAALRLKAVREGDDYVLNGAKIWTTHAHFATRMIALVRTSDTGKRQDGITCLLVDMKSPGLSVRPIHTIGGDHEVNEVFFDSVRVPAAQRVGAEGEGWSIAKYLLEFERGGNVSSPSLRVHLAAATRLAAKSKPSPLVDSRIAELGVDIDALEMLELRINMALGAGRNPGVISSMLKLRASQLQQAVSDLALSILGEQALRWEAHRPLHEIQPSDGADDDALPIASRYLNNRANTIFGGSSEIQKGIIARELLGL